MKKERQAVLEELRLNNIILLCYDVIKSHEEDYSIVPILSPLKSAIIDYERDATPPQGDNI